MKNRISHVYFSLLLLAPFSQNSEAGLVSDFSWLSSSPSKSASTVLADGTELSLTSSHVAMQKVHGSLVSWQDSSSRNTEISFYFDRLIEDFRLTIRDLDGEFLSPEYLWDFSILPTNLSGDLQFSGNTVRGKKKNANGEILWTDVATNHFSFKFVRGFNSALNSLEFEISEAAEVPAPSTVLLLTGGLAAFSYCRIKRKNRGTP
jgi:hypothetical protein